MNEFRADLHCHTNCSDGSYSPEELVRHAKDLALSGLSITDHDTIEAYATAVPLCQELGILLLPGIEFSTVLNGVGVHILGYGFDLKDPSLAAFCTAHVERRYDRNQAILERLSASGMPLSLGDVLEVFPKETSLQHRVVGRPHIAQAMIKRGYVSSVNEAFRRFIGEGKPYYIPGASFSTQETIDLIHQVGGVAVIAHPHLIREREIIKTLLTMNFDGIECYYGHFSLNANERWLKIANEKNWLITGGSDFHGDVKPDGSLGSSWINKELFDRLVGK